MNYALASRGRREAATFEYPQGRDVTYSRFRRERRRSVTPFHLAATRCERRATNSFPAEQRVYHDADAPQGLIRGSSVKAHRSEFFSTAFDKEHDPPGIFERSGEPSLMFLQRQIICRY